jgi:type I restriction enzyme S subunit
MEKQENIPKLRFPEFHGQWENRRLNEYLEFKNGINASKEQYGSGYKYISVLDILNNDFITYDKIIGSVNVNKDVINKYPVNYGDILFQRSSETREEVGTASVYLDKEKTATFGGFVIRGRKIGEYEPVFLNRLLRTDLSRNQITSKSGGSTRYNVGQDILSSIILPFPSLHEQQKIASFFTAIDSKISQLKRKKTLLEHYKKGVMQKIFSQEIRFRNDNGQEFPKWEKAELGDLLLHKAIRNKESKVTLVLSVSNTRGFITQSEQFDNHRVASVDVSNYKIVNRNDFAYNPSRINIGSIARLTDYNEGIVSPMYVVFGLRESLNAIFFENWIDTHRFKYLVRTSCSGSVRDSLNFEDMCIFPIKLPFYPEQTKIANFLLAIDDKINHTKKQMEKAELWKKGLMQQMFC